MDVKEEILPTDKFCSRITRLSEKTKNPISERTDVKNEESIFKRRKRNVFQPPREAPVFYPAEKEFEDCLGYVRKIKPIAEKFGICKIVPPKNWRPPFDLDIKQLKIMPRIQRINELDAKTRIKLNFINLIMTFWKLQGRIIKKPVMDFNRTLDLYTLRQLVHRKGGFDSVNKDKLWNSIASEMEYTQRNAGDLLKAYYEDLLLPYDIYVIENSGLNFSIEKSTTNQRSYRNKQQLVRNAENEIKIEENSDVIKTENKSDQNVADVKNEKEAKSDILTDPKKESKENKELKKLQFFGAGPKMAGYPSIDIRTTKRECKQVKKNVSLNVYNCLICDLDDNEEVLMICVKCSTNYHIYCLKPPLKKLPKGEWHCPSCLASKIRKCSSLYGFEPSNREYSLRQFGESADVFKCHYFQRPVYEISSSAVEQEFWNIAEDLDAALTVEYGADLHSMDYGSGFPTVLTGSSRDAYVKSPWNLNNIPVIDGSVLKYIGCDISGMKIPWMYVGMCFSAFCWHNEDHWSYSINYLHWGEAKTWYGVPGSCADDFENVMKNEAAELFESQPDLLHQLVTIMNPNVFVKNGIPVSRLDQQAGEFVITFPRAYHCGFNQGYNFAEAVNFSPPDWIKIGRECISHYAQLKRYCVFSHDELICKMASLPTDVLCYTVYEALLEDLIVMVEEEKRSRKFLYKNGILAVKKINFETIPDNERMCRECKTTCFLSGIQCKNCSKDKYYCSQHWNKICKCSTSNYVFCYRYTMDELTDLVTSIEAQVLKQRDWLRRVESVLKTKRKKNLHHFITLLKEADLWKNTKSDYVHALNKIINLANDFAIIIETIKKSTVYCCSETNNNNNDCMLLEHKITVKELQDLIREVDALPCYFKEIGDLLEMAKKISDFRLIEEKLYKKSLYDISYMEIEKLLLDSQKLCVQCPEIESFYEHFKKFRPKIEEITNISDMS